jgi:hypothetical protein
MARERERDRERERERRDKGYEKKRIHCSRMGGVLRYKIL